MNRFTHALLFAGVLFAPLPAQLSSDVLVGGLRTEDLAPGALFYLRPTSTTVFQEITPTRALEQNAACLAADGVSPNIIYAGTYGRKTDGSIAPCLIYALEFASGKLKDVRVLNTTPMREDFIRAVAPVGKEVYYLGRRHVGTVSMFAGAPKPLIALEDWMDPRGMVSDGRYLYLATDRFEIRRYDLQKLSSWKRIAYLNQVSGEEIQNIALGNEGHLLVTTSDVTRRGRLLQVHRDSGKLLRELRLPMSAGRAISQDPETDEIYVVGASTTLANSVAVVIEDWKIKKGPIGRLPQALPAIAVMKPRNLYRTGKACLTADGSYARIGIGGRASTRTNGFTITLVTKPSMTSALLVGVEIPNQLPIDLTLAGAPGCELGVPNPFAMAVRRTDKNGWAGVSFPKPTSTTLDSGAVLNMQWVVDAPKANGLHKVTTKTARISVID